MGGGRVFIPAPFLQHPLYHTSIESSPTPYPCCSPFTPYEAHPLAQNFHRDLVDFSSTRSPSPVVFFTPLKFPGTAYHSPSSTNSPELHYPCPHEACYAVPGTFDGALWRPVQRDGGILPTIQVLQKLGKPSGFYPCDLSEAGAAALKKQGLRSKSEAEEPKEVEGKYKDIESSHDSCQNSCPEGAPDSYSIKIISQETGEEASNVEQLCQHPGTVAPGAGSTDPEAEAGAEITGAALKIQRIWRGFLVRRESPLVALKTVARVEEEVNVLAGGMEGEDGLLATACRNRRERVRLSEMLMGLLLRLDAVQTSIPYVRSSRKAVTKKVLTLQEKVDQQVGEKVEETSGGGRNDAAVSHLLTPSASSSDVLASASIASAAAPAPPAVTAAAPAPPAVTAAAPAPPAVTAAAPAPPEVTAAAPAPSAVTAAASLSIDTTAAVAPESAPHPPPAAGSDISDQEEAPVEVGAAAREREATADEMTPGQGVDGKIRKNEEGQQNEQEYRQQQEQQLDEENGQNKEVRQTTQVKEDVGILNKKDYFCGDKAVSRKLLEMESVEMLKELLDQERRLKQRYAEMLLLTLRRNQELELMLESLQPSSWS